MVEKAHEQRLKREGRSVVGDSGKVGESGSDEHITPHTVNDLYRDDLNPEKKEERET